MIEEIRDGLLEKRGFEQVLQNQAWVEWGNRKMGGKCLKWCLRQINAADRSSWKDQRQGETSRHGIRKE